MEADLGTIGRSGHLARQQDNESASVKHLGSWLQSSAKSVIMAATKSRVK